MENKFDSKPVFSDVKTGRSSTPLRIFSISTVKTENRKVDEEEMDFNSAGSDVSSAVEMTKKELKIFHIRGLKVIGPSVEIMWTRKFLRSKCATKP